MAGDTYTDSAAKYEQTLRWRRLLRKCARAGRVAKEKEGNTDYPDTHYCILTEMAKKQQMPSMLKTNIHINI